MKVKICLVFLCFCCCLTTTNAQEYMRISQTNGSVLEIPVSDIQKLTFSNVNAMSIEQQIAIEKFMLKLYPIPNLKPENISWYGKILIT